MGNILVNHKLYKDYKPYDNKSICIEILQNAEYPSENQRLLYFKKMNNLDFSLSDTREFWVDSAVKLIELSKILSQLTQIPETSLQVCKIQNLYTFMKEDLVLN